MPIPPVLPPGFGLRTDELNHQETNQPCDHNSPPRELGSRSIRAVFGHPRASALDARYCRACSYGFATAPQLGFGIGFPDATGMLQTIIRLVDWSMTHAETVALF